MHHSMRRYDTYPLVESAYEIIALGQYCRLVDIVHIYIGISSVQGCKVGSIIILYQGRKQTHFSPGPLQLIGRKRSYKLVDSGE